MVSCTVWWLLSSPQDANPQQTLRSHLLVRQQDPALLCNVAELSSSLLRLTFSGHCGLTEGWKKDPEPGPAHPCWDQGALGLSRPRPTAETREDAVPGG